MERKNFKVRVNPEQSKHLQELAFKIGYAWGKEKIIQYTKYPFLSFGFHCDCCISYGGNTTLFKNENHLPELTYAEAVKELGGEIKEELWICENVDKCKHIKKGHGCQSYGDESVPHEKSLRCNVNCGGDEHGNFKCIPVSEYERRKKENTFYGKSLLTAFFNEFKLKEEPMFSICNYIDEILTGLPPITKVLARQKKKEALIKHQEEINRRINSQFWEDGAWPTKDNVLSILDELEKEEKK